QAASGQTLSGSPAGTVVQAALPAALAHATRKAALRLGAGRAVGAGSARVVGLTEGVLKAMKLHQLKIVAVVCLPLGLLATGAGVLTCRVSAARQGDEEKGAAQRDRWQPDTGKRAATDRHGDLLPPGAIARLGTVRFRHGQHIEAIAFSPDGKVIASTGRGGRVVLHDAATGKKIRSFQVEPQAHSLRFAPDGKTLAAVVGHRRVCVWEAATGKRIRQFEFAEGPVSHLVFSHDGRTLAGGVENHKVHVWD